MSLSNKHRHKSRREKLKQSKRNTKIVLVFALIALAILAIKNRVYIYDYLRWSF